jgi:hypothetical protein
MTLRTESQLAANRPHVHFARTLARPPFLDAAAYLFDRSHALLPAPSIHTRRTTHASTHTSGQVGIHFFHLLALEQY